VPSELVQNTYFYRARASSIVTNATRNTFINNVIPLFTVVVRCLWPSVGAGATMFYALCEASQNHLCTLYSGALATHFNRGHSQTVAYVACNASLLSIGQCSPTDSVVNASQNIPTSRAQYSGIRVYCQNRFSHLWSRDYTETILQSAMRFRTGHYLHSPCELRTSETEQKKLL